MSRTIFKELAHGRRSKRLMQNGYYTPPVGESPRKDYSSEEDDAASIDSSTSSLYSERAVNYNERSPISHHRRRRRKGADAARALTKLGMSNLASKQKVASWKVGEAAGSQTASVVRQEHSSLVTASRSQMHTTITSVKMSQKLAKGESASITHLQQTHLNHIERGGAAYENSESNHNTSLRRVVHADAHMYGEGDRTMRSQAHTSKKKESHVIHDNYNQETNRSFEHDQVATLQYSSAESDAEEIDWKGKEYAALVPIVSTRLFALVISILSVISSSFAQLCKMIYQTTLSIFVWDVWWLSLRTSPLLTKITRLLLAGLLMLLLLSGIYLISWQFLESDSSTLLLVPIQTVVSVFRMLSQKVDSFAQSTGSVDTTFEAPIKVENMGSGAPYPTSYPELEEALSKMELQFAEKLVGVKKDLDALQKEQLLFNKRQDEEFRNALSSLEGKLQLIISKQQQEANEKTSERLQLLQVELASIRMNLTNSRAETATEIDQIRSLLSDRSQTAAKVNEFNTKLAAFEARLNTLNNWMIKSSAEFDEHVGNTTYLKEIAKMQFIESFLQLMKTHDEAQGVTDGQKNLHFLFIAWLKKQGFAQIVEVDRSIHDSTSGVNSTMEALEKKMMIYIEKIKQTLQRHSSTLTIERIVERPLKAGTALDGNTEGQVREWIRKELDVYSADRIALADHALESAGGFVVSTRCSESYDRKTALVSLFGIPIYYNINTPRSVIQASTLPGECWSIKGSEGYVVIALSGPVQPTAFSLEHIPRELSPYGRIDSAPKDFVVLGLDDQSDYEGTELGRFRYEESGPVIQQFPVVAQQPVDFFTHVELRVSSNWGHPDYTCIYRFRVHGTRKDSRLPLV